MLEALDLVWRSQIGQNGMAISTLTGGRRHAQRSKMIHRQLYQQAIAA